MKRFYDFLTLLLIAVMGGAMMACEPTPPVGDEDEENPPVPELKAEIKAELVSVSKTDAEIALTTKGLNEYAYVVLKKDATAEESAEAIFDAFNERTECEDGTHTIKLTALESSVAYKVLFAGMYGDEQIFEKIAKVEFTTSDDFSMSVTWVEGATSATSAQLKLTTKGIAQYAWVAFNKDASTDNQSADLLFAKGTVCDCQDGENIVNVTGLTADRTYKVLIAGSTINDDFYENVLQIEVSTSRFSEELTIYDIDYMSFKAHLNFPRTKVQEGNVLKVGLMDVATYNLYESTYSDASHLNLNDAIYHNYIKGDSTFIFDEEHNYFEYKGGEGEEDDDLLNYFSPIVPGQPMYLKFGEFAYSPVDTDHRAGWGPGYYIPLFNEKDYWQAYLTGTNVNQADFWTGYYRNEFVQAKMPGVMEDVPEVTFNLTPKGTGTIRFEPTDNIWAYCFFVADAATYMNGIMPMLGNKSEYLQWFTTSYIAMYEVAAQTAYSAIDLVVEQNYYLERDTKYYLFVTSLSDEQGSKQSFKRWEFKLPEPTQPAPTIVVTAVPEKNTDSEVFFNIKAPNKDVEDVKYIANYERDWEALRNQLKKAGFPQNEIDPYIINQYGGTFKPDEIKEINSEAGLEISISTREDASMYCGAIGYNYEGTASASSIAQTRSLEEPAAERVESPLFNSLKGDWVASATIIGQEYIDNVLTPFERIHTSNVKIGEVGYESKLPDDVYAFFYKSTSLKTKEEVDAVYEEFKQSVDDYNRKTRNQNRILCQGFDFDIYGYNGQTYSTFKSPYELFISEDYSGYNYESPVFDFGPKWYLEIAKDGTVTAPFNINYFAPASQWWYYQYHFIGIGVNPEDNGTYSLPYVYNELGDVVTGHFPVVVEKATDGSVSKITVKPIVVEGVTYYPNIGRTSTMGYSVSGQIVSDVVLTPAKATTSKRVQSLRNATGKDISTISRYKATPNKSVRKSKTALPENKQFKPLKRMTFKPINLEQFNRNTDKYLEKRFGPAPKR